MKKLAVLFLALCLLLGVTANAEVELEIYGWMTEQESGLMAMFDAFNAKHEGEIKANLSLIPWSNMWQKISVSAAAQDGNCSDVYATGTQYSYDYARNGWLLDIQDLIDSGKIDVSKFHDVSLQPFTVDGKLIGVPKDYDSVAVFYNKAIFDTAGVPYPDGYITWAEYADIAAKLTNAEAGIYGTSVYGSVQNVLSPLFASNGGGVWDENNKCIVNSAENVEVMEALYALIEAGSAPTMEQLAEVGADSRFQNGTLGMHMQGSWMTAQFASVLGENLGITTMPYFDNPKTDLNTVAWVGHAFTDHPDEAKELLAYLATYEAAHLTKDVVIPAYEGTDLEWAEAFKPYGAEAFFKWQSDGSGIMKPMPTAHGMEAMTIVEGYLAECFFSGDIAANLDAAVEESDALMQ